MSKSHRRRRGLRRVRQLFADSKLSDFNPKKSVREQRKLRSYMESQQMQRQPPTTIFDAKGRYRANGFDICDCLDNTCPGCHFPCPSCKNTKCGPCCRVNRKWPFESIQHEEKELIIKNKLLEKIK